MFIRVFHGQPKDLAETRRRMMTPPLPVGWLGTTMGTTADGGHIAVIRFRSAEDALAGPDWAGGYAAPEVHDCPFVQLMMDGGRDDAGFVQILQGTARDPARVQALNDAFSTLIPKNRPGVIGATVAWDGPFFTDTIYFPDEEAARFGEDLINTMTGDYKDIVNEWNSLVDGLCFFDLRAPELLSP